MKTLKNKSRHPSALTTSLSSNGQVYVCMARKLSQQTILAATLFGIGVSAALGQSATFNISNQGSGPHPLWLLNGETAPLGQSVNPIESNNSFSASIVIDPANGLDSSGYSLNFINSVYAPGAINFGLSGSASTASSTQIPYETFATVTGKGAPQSTGGTTGPAINATLNWLTQPATLGTAVLSLTTEGAEGQSIVTDGGVGGAITFTQPGGVFFTNQETPASSSGTVPWRPDFAVVDVLSVGGAGAIYDQTVNYYTSTTVGTGGKGGSITATVNDSSSANSLLDGIFGLTNKFSTPVAYYLFQSRGGSGAADSRHTGAAGINGEGGAVGVTIKDVDWAGSLSIGSKAYGVVVASVGGASNVAGSGVTMNATPSGAGGDVNVAFDNSKINFTGAGQSIGLVATSTGDLIAANSEPFKGGANSNFGDVTVTLSSGSSVSATQFGLIANSTPGWSTDPFTGAATGSVYSPGNGGSVSVTNEASIAVTGDAAVGVLMQSIGGTNASVLGTALFVGDSGGSGGMGGSVTYDPNRTGGGSITATGRDVIGIALQSVGGGGGNGANTDGLFVAVGGAGGSGGSGGEVVVNLTDHVIQTTGLHAKAVVAHSIGGGGGNGGTAKEFSIGPSPNIGIGGRGGIGGDGGSVSLAGSNAQISTHGQHAYGVALQSIGGGGGTGGAAHGVSASAGFAVSLALGGSGGAAGAGGAVSVDSLDSKSRVTTNGLDAVGILLQSISGGGGAGGAASAQAYNIGNPPEVPAKITFTMSAGGSGGSSQTPGKISVTNNGSIATSGAGSHGLVLQSVGGGGGHGGDSTAGSNSWGDDGRNPELQFEASVSLGGSGGAAGDGGAISVTSTGTIATAGHNSIGLLAHAVGGGGGSGSIGNAYSTSRWVGNNEGDDQAATTSISMNLGAGGSGGAAGDGGDITVTVNRDNGYGFTTIGSGSSGLVAQSVGGGGGVAGNAGTKAINGGTVSAAMQLGGQGGNGGDGGAVTVKFEGTIQTGAVTQLQYTDDSGTSQLSEPVAIGGSSHGIVAQSVGGGGGIGGNADPSTALVPTLTSDVVNWQYDLEDIDPKKIDPKQIKTKIMNIKDGIVYWAKRVVESDDKRPSFSISYSANVSLGGSGGKGGTGGDVTVDITDRSDITTYGHHSYAIMAQSIGGGGGVAGTASANSLVSGDVKAKKLASDISVGISMNVGGSGGVSGNGGDVSVLVSNPLSSSFNVPNNVTDGNYLRTGGYASHVVFAQSVGGGGGVGHEGSIIGITALPGVKNPDINLGHKSTGVVAAGNGGNVAVGSASRYVTGWIESAGDASSLIFAQSVGGGGGTVSTSCTTNGRKGNQIIKHSPCFTDAAYTWDGAQSIDYSAGSFVNDLYVTDMTINANGGDGGDVSLYLGDSHLTTDGDRAIAIMAQSIGGGGGYMSADAQNVGKITQSVAASVSSEGGDVALNITGGQGGAGTAYISTYGAGAWGVLAQSVGGGGGLFGDTSLDIVGVPSVFMENPKRCIGDECASGSVSVKLTDAIIKTHGKNSHGIVAQSWSGGGGVFAGSEQSEVATLVMGSKLSGGSSAYMGGAGSVQVLVTLDKTSIVNTSGDGAIAVLAQTNILAASTPIVIVNEGAITGGATYTNTSANNRVVHGVGVMISGSSYGGNVLNNSGSISTVGGVKSGYAIMTDYGVTNIDNYGTITGSVDLGSTPGTFTNESSGTLNKGAVYKVGNNSLHNYGTINIGQADSVGTTNLEGRLVQYESGRTVVTFDALADQTHDRLIVDGTAVIGGSLELHAKSLLSGDYEFLRATELTVTAEALDRLLFDWDATVNADSITVTPTRTFRTEGLSLSPTSQNLVSYLERAWDNSDAHHGALFGYKHELEAVQDYNALLEGLGGQALNAQPLQMRMSVLSNLGDSMACPVVTPNGLSLGEDRCVWAKLTGEVSDLSSSQDNLGYRSTGGGLRVGTQQTLGQGWTVGAAAGYALNDLTATDFSSNGQVFDLSLSAKRDVGQWSFGGSLGFAHGWFDNNRRVRAADAGIASGFNRQYNSKSRLSIYSAKLRAAYTFEQEAHYIRPYLDVDVAYSQAPGFSESGEGNLALQAQSNSQWNVGISPMVEYGADFVREDKTRMMFYVSAGATFLPNNQQTTAMSFVGAQAANGTFDIITDGPNVLGRLNIGMQVYEQEGYEVRAQYGLQAGKDYWSQNVSINAVFRF